MSGESPTENKDYFNFGRSTPPPTTSYLPARVDYEGTSTTDAATAALMDPKKDKDKDKDRSAEDEKEDKEKDDKDKEDKDEKDKEHAMGPGENPGGNKEGDSSKDDRGDKKEDKGDKDDKRKKDENKNAANGDCANWKREPKVDEEEEEDDDSAVVKCLYYSMQCCECTIS